MQSKRLVNLLVGSLFLAGLFITSVLLPERAIAHIMCPIYIPWPIDSTEEGCPHVHSINFKICNERGNGGDIIFYLNGIEEYLRDGYCTSFSNYPDVTVISYDMWYLDGYQGMEYNLSDGGSYYFTEISQGIGFYLR